MYSTKKTNKHLNYNIQLPECALTETDISVFVNVFY